LRNELYILNRKWNTPFRLAIDALMKINKKRNFDKMKGGTFKIGCTSSC